MAVERLQKILSNAGVASRREAEAMILAGRVSINGTVASELGARADLDADEVTVDGVPVIKDRYRYFLLNKPAGFVTTADDELGRETVLDLVPIGDIQLHPVGRLDMDSEGLLLVTNDGHLTDLLTHPRYEVEKEYLVGLDGPLSNADLQRLVRGVESEGERLRATSAQQAMAPQPGLGEDPAEAPAWALLTLREGKNREIRRMMAALGRQVLLLRRIRLGPVHLGALGSGSFRELTSQEVSALYNSAKQAEARSAARDDTEAARSRSIAPVVPPSPGDRRPRRGEQASSRLAPARPALPAPNSRSSGAGKPKDRPAGTASRGARPGMSSSGPQRGAFGGKPTARKEGPPAGTAGREEAPSRGRTGQPSRTGPSTTGRGPMGKSPTNRNGAPGKAARGPGAGRTAQPRGKRPQRGDGGRRP